LPFHTSHGVACTGTPTRVVDVPAEFKPLNNDLPVCKWCGSDRPEIVEDGQWWCRWHTPTERARGSAWYERHPRP
jgi:hypothetical protein